MAATAKKESKTPASEESVRVAVYGTLRKTFPNHYLIKEDNTNVYLGECKLPGFKMFSMGGFPSIIESKGKNTIVAEVFLVTPYTLSILDLLEGHPKWYKRKEVVTPFGKAWVYVMPEEKVKDRQQIRDGDWKGHRG